MFLDASAVFAILNREPDCKELLDLVGNSPTQIVYSPLSRFEAIVSLARNRAGPHRSATAAEIEEVMNLVDTLLVTIGARGKDLTESVGHGALSAAKTFGRAVGHPAGLNLGDCFAYACAKEAKVKIIYKGNDFSRTDLA